MKTYKKNTEKLDWKFCSSSLNTEIVAKLSKEKHNKNVLWTELHAVSILNICAQSSLGRSHFAQES